MQLNIDDKKMELTSAAEDARILETLRKVTEISTKEPRVSTQIHWREP
jgi:hypothetical protein